MVEQIYKTRSTRGFTSICLYKPDAREEEDKEEEVVCVESDDDEENAASLL